MRTLLIATLLLLSPMAWADSPLTSTPFSRAYQDVKWVQMASEADEVLSPQLVKFLLKKGAPIDQKLAAINALGWDFNGTDNHATFWAALSKKRRYASYDELVYKGSAEDIICLAYMMALDNYFEVGQAARLAKIAMERAPNTYSIQLVGALILAQHDFDDWCKVFQHVDDVRQRNLPKDMREEAVVIIFEYMDLYRDSC